MLGITLDKLVILGILAVIILGPERLPRYASYAADLVRRARAVLESAKERARTDMGAEFDDIDWRSLDPRQYDPRRIIRQALLDDPPPISPPTDPPEPDPPLSPGARHPVHGHE